MLVLVFTNKKEPLLLKCYNSLIKWVKNIMFRKSAHTNTLFSIEKRINLDGPIGNNYYLYALRRKSHMFFSRQLGDDFVIAWGVFSHAEKWDLKELM